jgi:hypothetical protein
LILGKKLIKSEEFSESSFRITFPTFPYRKQENVQVHATSFGTILRITDGFLNNSWSHRQRLSESRNNHYEEGFSKDFSNVFLEASKKLKI